MQRHCILRLLIATYFYLYNIMGHSKISMYGYKMKIMLKQAKNLLKKKDHTTLYKEKYIYIYIYTH